MLLDTVVYVTKIILRSSKPEKFTAIQLEHANLWCYFLAIS